MRILKSFTISRTSIGTFLLFFKSLLPISKKIVTLQMQTERYGLPKKAHFRLILLLVNLDTSQIIMLVLEKMIIPFVW